MMDAFVKAMLVCNMTAIVGMGYAAYRQVRQMHPQVARAMRPLMVVYLALFLMLAGFLAYFCATGSLSSFSRL
jgi:hypothetical protein